jgi:hypothetical protein
MSNTIKIPGMFLALILLVLLPITSNVWADEHGRDDGRSHHERGFHAHANPDLTLVSGMEGIDSRVLIASDPDQTPEVIDQPVQEIIVNAPLQIAIAHMDTFIVNVPNNTGGYTPVLIKKWGNGYLGPQGELYYPFPEVAQLKAMYGI